MGTRQFCSYNWQKACAFVILILFIYLYQTFLNFQDSGTKLQTMPNESEQALKSGSRESSEVSKKNITLVYWSLFFGEVLHFDHLNLSRCSVPCEVTSDKTKVGNASALIIHARDPYPLPPKNLTSIPWILQSLENPVYTPVLSKESYLANFNYLFAYHPEEADFYLPSFPIPRIQSQPTEFRRKTGLVLAVFSNCEVGRTAYLKELMKHIQVDSHGQCLNNKQGLSARYSSNDFKKHKIELARNYKFTLVFENQDCDYFVDDQLTHALTAGSVPVFLGTDKVSQLLSGNLRQAIIEVKDFKTPKKLAEYLKLVSENEQLYNHYLRWKYYGYQFPELFYQTVHGYHWYRMENHPTYHASYCIICETFAKLKSLNKPVKARGLIKPLTCKAREIGDWLKGE